MKKSNAILQAAVSAALLSLAGVAGAGTISGNTNFATEVFGPTATSTLGITPGAINYSMSTATNVNPGAHIYFTLRLVGAKFSTAPAVGELKFAGVTCVATSGGASPACTVTLSTDKTTVQVDVVNGTSTTNLGLGALTYTPAALGIDNVNTTLATAGGVVNMKAAVTLTAAANAGALDSTNAMPATIDTPEPTAAIATSVQAITGSIIASSAFPTAGTALGAVETGKINLALANPGSLFTTTTNATSTSIINLGAIKFANNTGVQFKADGTTAYMVGNMSVADKMSGTVTGSFKTGSTVNLFTAATCAATAAGGVSVMTPATSPTTATFTNAQIPGFAAAEGAGADLFLCLTVPTTTTTAIPETTPVASFAITAANKAATTDAASTASGNLYAVTTNGASYDVRSYVPASASGYTSFVRVINTGLIAAPVSIAKIDETTGVAGTAAVVIPSLAAGAAKTLTSTEIEAVIGAITPDTARPRLRVTAPTNAINVQSFMLQPGGAFTDATGAQ